MVPELLTLTHLNSMKPHVMSIWRLEGFRYKQYYLVPPTTLPICRGSELFNVNGISWGTGLYCVCNTELRMGFHAVQGCSGFGHTRC